MASIKRGVGHLFVIILTSLLLLIAIEFAVRFLYPQINFQGNQRAMLVENKFQQTMGLVPNASGEFFGKRIRTDAYGFRQLQTPHEYQKSWLFLGDSVTFGVAVSDDMVFSQLIQNEFQHIRIWNTAVVGYSAVDYLNVVRDFVPDHDDLAKIILYFCLNDVYGNLSLSRSASAKEMVLSFLRSNSKLYLLLKNVFTDRSKVYALNDIDFYAKHSPKIDKHLSALAEIKSIADKLAIQFIVVLLPYEYQLRSNGLRAPQVRLKEFCQTHHIQVLDLFSAFMMRDSKDYFLYGDPMHLSPYGHQAVANQMIEELKETRP